MPCYDSRDTAAYGREDAQHNSPVADLLCGVLTALTAEGRPLPNVSGLAAWWAEHQKRDAAKRADETIIVYQFQVDGRGFGSPYRPTRSGAEQDACDAGYGIMTMKGAKLSEQADIGVFTVKRGEVRIEHNMVLKA